ncbi:MAG: translation initiation factor IF-2 [Bacilli bacterium]|nr:translation initiation factor IF-2 [Bacilli bacterium]
MYDDKYDEYERGEKQYTRIKNVKKKNKGKENRQSNVPVKQEQKVNEVYYVPGMTAGNLADELHVSSGEIIKKLIQLGYMVSISQPIDREVLEFLADDYGFELKDKINYDITKFEEMVIEDDEESLVKRPPIVTIMGHVDHGKTTLLDTIRSSRVAMGEAGGITQHIGAYQVTVKGEKITFIDTPGHAAFTEMRARGAMVTDIVVLVVAADDGVMPQTKEAIDHAQAAKVPIIVAVNKMDKPQANPDRVKQELTAYNLVPSEWGGDTEFVNISALTGMGVDDLLETILMVSEIHNYRANPNRLGMGTVIEAQLTKGRGPVATFLVKNGTIKVGDPVVVGNVFGKVRAMQDETKANLKQAGPSKAVEVTGLEDVPQAGDHFMVFEDEKVAKLVSIERVKRANLEKNQTKAISLAAMFANLDDTNKEINLIIRTDVQGSAEALVSSLEKVKVEGVKINIIRSGAGMITDNDISLAVASKSIIIGFNIRPNSIITKQAAEKGIEIRLYNIIYKLLEDIEAAMKGLLDPVFEEKTQGELEVRKIFKVSKIGTIAGSYVTNGVVTRNSEVRLIREGIVIYTGKIGTLKRGQDDVKEVKQGYECGLTIQNYNDIKEGDIIETFIMEEVE